MHSDKNIPMSRRRDSCAFSDSVRCSQRETRLRILHLEDDLSDRELVRRAWEESGIPGDFVYAGTEAEFRSALQRERYDIIFADVTLPAFDGFAALSLAQALSPDVPFLFVSGTIGEEPALARLTSGATDYISTNHLQRVKPVVQRALRESEERAKRKAAEAALRASRDAP